jgi:tRNA(Ile)-lysidine synthase
MTHRTEAISDRQFCQLMEATGPYEARPLVAVGVSGGADSMALVLLADAWCRNRGGRATALTVNHRLRAEAEAEARQVGEWLAARDIEHRVLEWSEPKPASGLQAAARTARYDLMTDWCRQHGVLHLALAHSRDDQAETLLMRLGKGSGPDGLAAMSPIRETPACRLVRPLLAAPRGDLEATLVRAGQDWIEDPSNRDRRFARVRVREAMAAAGLSSGNLARSAARYGRARVALEVETSRLVAVCCDLHASGFAYFDPSRLFAAADDISLRALARIITAVGGTPFAPGRDRLERLHGKLKDAGGRRLTLGRCRIMPQGGRVLVCREDRNLPPPLPVLADKQVIWDGRFQIAFCGTLPTTEAQHLAALGRRGWDQVVGRIPELRSSPIPYAARRTLPALFDEAGVISVPHVGFERDPGSGGMVRLALQPRNALSGSGFFVA